MNILTLSCVRTAVAGTAVIFVPVAWSQQVGPSPEEPGAPAATKDTGVEWASDLEGAAIAGPDGELLGIVDSLALDFAKGEVAYIIVSPAGGPALDGALRAVPPDAVELTREAISPGALALRVGLEQEEWLEAPAVERSGIEQLHQAQRGREIYDYYGLRWEQRAAVQFGAADRGPAAAPPAGDRRETGATERFGEGRRETGATEREGQGRRETGATEPPRDQRRERSAAEPLDEPRREVGATEPPGQSGREVGATERERRVEREVRHRLPPAPAPDRGLAEAPGDDSRSEAFGAPPDRAGQLHLSTHVARRPLVDAAQEPVGRIGDFLVDMANAQIRLVVVRSEATSGRPEGFALDPDWFATGAGGLMLNITREQLEAEASEPVTALEEWAAAPPRPGEPPAIFRLDDDEAAVFGAPPGDRGGSQSDPAGP